MLRRLTQFAGCAVLLCATAGLAHAQRGPGGGAPGGGGMGGGMMDHGNGMRPDFGHGDGRMRMPGGANPTFGTAVVHGPQLGPPGRWWDDHKLSKTLNLRPEQQRRMDDIFEASKGQLLTLYSNYQREEQKLATMPPADLQDESKVFAGIDRVTQARAEVEKENAHILLQIRHEMDGDQLVKLEKAMTSGH